MSKNSYSRIVSNKEFEVQLFIIRDKRCVYLLDINKVMKKAIYGDSGILVATLIKVATVPCSLYIITKS